MKISFVSGLGDIHIEVLKNNKVISGSYLSLTFSQPFSHGIKRNDWQRPFLQYSRKATKAPLSIIAPYHLHVHLL